MLAASLLRVGECFSTLPDSACFLKGFILKCTKRE